MPALIIPQPVKTPTICPCKKKKTKTQQSSWSFSMCGGSAGEGSSGGKVSQMGCTVPLCWLTLFLRCPECHPWIQFLSTLFALSPVKTQQNSCNNYISLRWYPFDWGLGWKYTRHYHMKKPHEKPRIRTAKWTLLHVTPNEATKRKRGEGTYLTTDPPKYHFDECKHIYQLHCLCHSPHEGCFRGKA